MLIAAPDRQLLSKQQNCVTVFFTACRTSLIFQQYKSGFRDEFSKNTDIVKDQNRLRDGVRDPMLTITPVTKPNGR